jgi:TRAP-type C4-dicarboxylate transport system permease small subunit
MLVAEQKPGPLGRVGRALARLGNFIWRGKYPVPPPPAWTLEETEAAWAKGEIPPPYFPDTAFGRFDRNYTRFTKWWSYLAGIGLLVIVLVLVEDTLGWKIAGKPFPSSNDFVANLNVVAVFFAVAFLHMDRGSMAIEMWQRRFPRLFKVGLRTFASLLGMAVCFYCAYRGIILTDGYVDNVKKVSGVWRFLIWPFGAAMVIGFILLGVGFVVTSARDFVEFKERRARYGLGVDEAGKTSASPTASERSSK